MIPDFTLIERHTHPSPHARTLDMRMRSNTCTRDGPRCGGDGAQLAQPARAQERTSNLVTTMPECAPHQLQLNEVAFVMCVGTLARKSRWSRIRKQGRKQRRPCSPRRAGKGGVGYPEIEHIVAAAELKVAAAPGIAGSRALAGCRLK
eukprot:scaffold167606_cov36-Tisochrysis_lutea.AAC.1